MKTKPFTLLDLLVVTAIILFVTATLTAALGGSRHTAVRLTCRTNLIGIGRAMTVFAAENNGAFPRAGCWAGYWRDVAIIPRWYGDYSARGTQQDEDTAFGIIRDDNGEIVPGYNAGKATITSSFYLLVKYNHLLPKQFLCRGDAGVTEWKPVEFYTTLVWGGFLGGDIRNAWDFGDGSMSSPYPGEVCSYAYHMPYSVMGTIDTHVIDDMSHPASPVCADRNPFLDKNAAAPQVGDNSASHAGFGQNVLYKDGSVRFETSPTVGIGGDNIYTYGGDPNGTPPAGHGDGFPIDENDAYLVNQANYLP